MKNCIVQVDASPFTQWYLNHYGINIGKYSLIQVEKQKKPQKLQQNLKKLKKDCKKEIKIELLIPKSHNNLVNKDY